jgi:hypothetical protein
VLSSHVEDGEAEMTRCTANYSIVSEMKGTLRDGYVASLGVVLFAPVRVLSSVPLVLSLRQMPAVSLREACKVPLAVPGSSLYNIKPIK